MSKKKRLFQYSISSTLCGKHRSSLVAFQLHCPVINDNAPHSQPLIRLADMSVGSLGTIVVTGCDVAKWLLFDSTKVLQRQLSSVEHNIFPGYRLEVGERSCSHIILTLRQSCFNHTRDKRGQKWVILVNVGIHVSLLHDKANFCSSMQTLQITVLLRRLGINRQAQVSRFP